MEYSYLITITRSDGKKVHLRPGSQGERDLIADVVQRTKDLGVGMFRTEAHVAADVKKALEDSLMALKREVLPGG